jgi:acetyltransferase
MWRYTRNLQALYETPALTAGPAANAASHRRVEGIIQTARKANRTLLTELESKQVLEAYGIPTVATRIAKSEDHAVQIATEIGRTVVLKLYSEVVTHKTDVGGVKLNLATENEVRGAYRSIKESVQQIPGAFPGVTVEPMLSWTVTSLSSEVASIRSLEQSFSSVQGDSSSKSTGIVCSACLP